MCTRWECVCTDIRQSCTFVVSKGRETVRMSSCSYPMKSSTSCGRATRRDGEDKFLWLSNEIMYYFSLWVGKCRETMRMCFWSYPMISPTLCGWAKAERRSGCASAAIQWNHVLLLLLLWFLLMLWILFWIFSVGGQRSRDGEDVFLQLSNEIMYFCFEYFESCFLWVGKGGEGQDVFLQLSNEIMYIITL